MTLYKNTAKQHSTSGGAAKNAVDGNLDTYSKTDNDNKDKWWLVCGMLSNQCNCKKIRPKSFWDLVAVAENDGR